jgi:Arc/MetJ-type ribon-helix-helix transcriptional regulator
MRNVVSISLPDVLVKELKTESKLEHTSLSDVIRKSLKDYLFRTKFDRVRKRAQMQLAKTNAIATEEDILNLPS